MNTWKTAFSIFLLIFCVNSINASIRESIDTTDNEGFGMDSLFRIHVNVIPVKFRDSIIDYHRDTIISFSGQLIAHYIFNPHWCSGYFNLTFDDICLAPDTVLIDTKEFRNSHSCFVVKNTIHNTYSKLQVLNSLSGNRFVYRYLTNESPGSRILIDTSASPKYRAMLLKVNNPHFTGIKYFYNSGTDVLHTSRLSWDPPAQTLVNSTINPANIKYILYRSKDNVQIDTTKPLDRSQWIPINFFSNSPQTVGQFPQNGYVNMVAVIGKDTSEFLSGWTLCNYDIIGTIGNNPPQKKVPAGMTINSSTGRTIVTLTGEHENNERGILSMYDLTGNKISTLIFSGKSVSLNNGNIHFSNSGYVLKVTFPGKETVTARFLQSR
jgi:hypothetical protein